MSSLKDIAQELNLSISMVSKVLNNRLGTSSAPPETIRAIQAKAEELHYRKNVSAAALASGRSHVIGIYIHNYSRLGESMTAQEKSAGRFGLSSSNLIETVLLGIADELIDHQLRMMLGFFSTKATFARLLESCSRAVLDGIIVVDGSEQVIGELLKSSNRELPILTIHERRKYQNLPRVSCDQVAVGDLATGHLLEQGCRKIMYIGHFEDRFEGYCRALRRAGLEPDPELIFRERLFHLPEGVALWERLPAAFARRIDGVVAQTDELAIGTMQALRRRGIPVPEAVKVIGVDNSPYCELLETPLSSIDQSIYEVGLAAARQMVRLLDGAAVGNLLIEPKLRARVSTLSAARAVPDDAILPHRKESL